MPGIGWIKIRDTKLLPIVYAIGRNELAPTQLIYLPPAIGKIRGTKRNFRSRQGLIEVVAATTDSLPWRSLS